MDVSISEFGVYALWAAGAGASLPLATTNNSILNTRAKSLNIQSFYTTLLGIVLGGFGALPLSLLSSTKWQAPTCWWSMLGGICTLPACGALIAAPHLGIQLTLLIILSAQLITTICLDSFDGRLLRDPKCVIGLFLVVLGAVLDDIREHPASHVAPRSLSQDAALVNSFFQYARQNTEIVDVALAAVVGIGYTLQAKCNSRLGKDLGDPVRATVVSSAVNCAASVPIVCFLCARLDIWPVFIAGDWPRFVFAAFQSAFYITTMTVLPARIGYTAAFMCIQCGSLCTSTVVDALGVIGEKNPVNKWRVIAMCLVVAGVWLFNLGSSGSQAHEREQGDVEELEVLMPQEAGESGKQVHNDPPGG